MSENLPSNFVASSKMPSLLAEVNVQELRYLSADDLLVVGSTVIKRSANGLFRLNDLHTAIAGGDESLNPNRFTRLPKIQRKIERLTLRYGPGVFETVMGGEDRGTYAHVAIAQAYATWLNEDYEDLLYEVAREVELRQVGSTQGRMDRLEAIVGAEKVADITSMARIEELEAEVEELNESLTFEHRVAESAKAQTAQAKKQLVLALGRSSAKRKAAIEEGEALASDLYAELNSSVSQGVQHIHNARESVLRVLKHLPADAYHALSNANDAKDRLDKALSYIAPETLD